MLEAQIQTQISNYLKTEGWLVVKNMTISLNGWPDLSAYHTDKHIMIEVKTPTGRLSRIQQYRIAQLRKLEHKVYVVSSLKQLKEEL